MARVVVDPAWKVELQRKLQLGMQEMMEEVEAGMKSDYSQAVSPPTSNPGEYPHIDTKQLVENIDSEVHPVGRDLKYTGKERVGQAGVKGYRTDQPKLHRGSGRNIGGLAALYLSRPPFNRKGLDDSFIEHEADAVKAFIKGAS